MDLVRIMEMEFDNNNVSTALDRLKDELHAPMAWHQIHICQGPISVDKHSKTTNPTNHVVCFDEPAV